MPGGGPTKWPSIMEIDPHQFWEAQNKALNESAMSKNTTVAPKNVPGKGDFVQAIQTGMKRPKRANNDYPSPGRMKA